MAINTIMHQDIQSSGALNDIALDASWPSASRGLCAGKGSVSNFL